MGDQILDTSQGNFDKTVQVLINLKLEELLRAPKPHLLPGNFIKATFKTGTNGTMRFLNIPDLTVDDAEITASEVQTEGEPNDTAKLAQGYEEFTTVQRMKSLKVTDVALLESPLELASKNAERLAEYVLKLADRIAANVILSGTNVIYSGTSNSATNQVASGDVLISLDIKKAVALLEDGSVPRFGDDSYRGIMAPFVKFDVETDDDTGGWLDAAKYAGADRLFSGELGKYAGVRFMVSSNAGKKVAQGTGSIDVYSTVIFGPEFFAMGDFGNNQTFVTPPGGHDDPGHQSAIFTWKGWLAGMVVGEGTNASNVSDPRYIRIESASSL